MPLWGARNPAALAGMRGGTQMPGQVAGQPTGQVPLRSFRKGGRVHRTGVYKLHAGERVIPARGRRRGRR